MQTLQALIRSADGDDDGLVWFRATSEAKDRHGTIIESRGVDLDNFLRNPIVGWGHRTVSGGDPDDVVGRVDSVERGTDYIDVGVRFADHERAQLTESLVRGGFVNSMSVGILPRKTTTRRVGEQRVPLIKESELLEVSIVSVGSNPEAQRILRSMMGEYSPVIEEEEDMDPAEIRNVVTEAVTPLVERLDAIETTLDEPERKPALSGARTSEDVPDLMGRWMQARAAGDSQLLHEIASHDPAPDIQVRDMLSAANYLPTQVSTRLVELVRDSSKFLGRASVITGSGASIILPREKTRMTAATKAENTDVITGGSELEEVTLSAHNFWAGERVPNRALADSPVAVANILLRQAASQHAALFDTEFVNGTTVTSGLEDITTASLILQDDDEPLATLIAQIADQYFDLAEQARPSSTWVINEAYAKHLSVQLDSSNRPVFGPTNAPVSAAIDGAQASTLFGQPVIVHSAVGADTAYLGDISRAVMVYQRDGLTAESSRDAEFAKDNTLFRFGWRYDIALVEEGQIEEFPSA